MKHSLSSAMALFWSKRFCMEKFDFLWHRTEIEDPADGVGQYSAQGAVFPGYQNFKLVDKRVSANFFAAGDEKSGKMLFFKRWQIKPIKVDRGRTLYVCKKQVLIHSKTRPLTVVRAEYERMKMCSENCDYILKVHGFFYRESFAFICMELATLDLQKCFKARWNRFIKYGNSMDLSDDDKFFMAGIRLYVLPPLLKALRHIHGMGIVHKDIKPENILLQLPEGLVKLCDFGGAYQIKEKKADFTEESFASKFCEWGTDCFSAPEVLIHSRCSYASDIWSTGMTILLCSIDGAFDALSNRSVVWGRREHTKQVSLLQLYRDCYKLGTLTRDDATLRLQEVLFHRSDYDFPISKEAFPLIKETELLARTMLHFSGLKRLSATQLLNSLVNTPIFGSLCCAWSPSEKDDSKSLAFARLKLLLLETLNYKESK